MKPMPIFDGSVVFLEIPSADKKASLPVIGDGRLRALWAWPSLQSYEEREEQVLQCEEQ